MREPKDQTTEPEALVGDKNAITLAFPANPRYFLLARMSTSALASQLSFGIDEIEELRLAIDELCSSCAAGAEEGARVELVFTLIDDVIEIHCTVSPVRETQEDEVYDFALLSQHLLAERILDALTDAHGITRVAPSICEGWIRRRRSGN